MPLTDVGSIAAARGTDLVGRNVDLTNVSVAETVIGAKTRHGVGTEVTRRPPQPRRELRKGWVVQTTRRGSPVQGV